MGTMCVRSSDEDYIPPSGFKPTILMSQDKSVDPTLKKAITFDNYKKFKWINHIEEHYVLGKELGHGSFGSVYMTENK